MQQQTPSHQHRSNLEMENQRNYEQHSMMVTILFDALTVLLRNGLQYFFINFQQKKILFNIDAYDAQLVKSFYNLNPTEEQVTIFQDNCFFFDFHFLASYGSTDMAIYS